MAANDNNMVDKLNENNSSFFSWIQSFSKKIVTTFSILYLAVVIAIVIMLMFGLRAGYTDGISTMITEINETFRVVIGGYLIKAAFENTFKITGAYFTAINKLKIKAMNNGEDLQEEDEEDIERSVDDEVPEFEEPEEIEINTGEDEEAKG